MKYIIFSHELRAWLNGLQRPVASIFDAALFDSEKEAAQVVQRLTRHTDLCGLEVCPWQGA